jgi:hypothetical protein
MRWMKIAVIVVGLLLISFGVNYTINHSIRDADFGPLAGLFSIRMGEALTTHLVDATPDENNKQLFETYTRAMQIGAFIVESGKTIPKKSDDLAAIDSRIRTDAWGQPFCLFGVRDRIVIVSAGPRGVLAGCDSMGVAPAEVPSLQPGRLFRLPSGSLVLVLQLNGMA